MDSLVYSKIYAYLNKYIIDQQHGVLPRLSTSTNLVVYIEDIMRPLNKDMSVHSIYTDLTRAFDTVNIDLLLRKLQGYGTKWFGSYLKGRK